MSTEPIVLGEEVLMKASHYSALFQYRPRPERKPIEDFLTCALTDILNRLTPEATRAFVRDLLLNESARSKWSEFGDQHKLTWSIQRSLGDAGRCDILLEDQGGPLLIIETKVFADFTRPQSADLSSGKESNPKATGEQLRRYGNWLREKCKKCEERKWPGALVLLTHLTDPPDDFEENSQSTYGVEFTNTVRWSQISLWLQELSENHENFSSHSHSFLAGELGQFLKERNMGVQTISPDDLKAAERFVCGGHATSITSSLQAIRGMLQADLRRLAGLKRNPTTSNTNFFDWDGHILDCEYFNESTALKNWVIEWGLGWPSSPWVKQLNKEGASIPNSVFWYVAVYCGESKCLPTAKHLLRRIKKLPGSWQIWGLESEADCGMFSACSASDRRLSGKENIDKVANWMRRELGEIRATVADLKRPNKSQNTRSDAQ